MPVLITYDGSLRMAKIIANILSERLKKENHVRITELNNINPSDLEKYSYNFLIISMESGVLSKNVKKFIKKIAYLQELYCSISILGLDTCKYPKQCGLSDIYNLMEYKGAWFRCKPKHINLNDNNDKIKDWIAYSYFFLNDYER